MTLLPMARKTIRMVSESNGQRLKALVQDSEFLAVDLKESESILLLFGVQVQYLKSSLNNYPTNAAYWKTPLPLFTLSPSEEVAKGFPL